MLQLPPAHRDRLRKPFGILYPEMADVIPSLAGRVIYTVGDVVTHNLLNHDLMPDIAVIDGYTMRTPYKKMPILPFQRCSVKNPAGTITDDLVAALREAVDNPPALIIVEGEEDLAVIPLLRIAQEGAVVLYGQPGEGVVACKVDEKIRALADEMLALFEDVDSECTE